ncbi:MAG: CYTH domain-containing protein [Alteromonadales bacterium]|nr:CYTH domain-containing protein [Alteromonadales bacterium]
MQEIERKFLIKDNSFKVDVVTKTRIIQGYLNSTPERTVRVRLNGEQGYLTIKGISSENGTSRFEWEKKIPKEEALALLEICEPGVIDKTRYLVPHGLHTFEVDEFYGENQGLTVAEVELSSEDEVYSKPAWLGEQVTGQAKYYNSMLVKNPYKSW